MAGSPVSFSAPPVKYPTLTYCGFPCLSYPVSLTDELRRAGVEDPTKMTQEVALPALESVVNSCRRAAFLTKPVIVFGLGVMIAGTGVWLVTMAVVALQIVGFIVECFGFFMVVLSIKNLFTGFLSDTSGFFKDVESQARELIKRIEQRPKDTEVEVVQQLLLHEAVFNAIFGRL